MSRQLLTPSPSPPPPVLTPTLPAQINAATRKQHTTLNRLILERLPLALPPRTVDPQLLGRGLGAFAAIFFLFEERWKELIDAVEADDKSLSGTHDAQVRSWLATLVPSGLPRTSRLKQDLEYISARTGTNVNKLIFLQSTLLAEIKQDISARPHILLAYGWVMYMAIFSGGRYIRQQLSSAGVEFWTGTDPCIEFDKDELRGLDLPGFSFLSFDGRDDGEGIKTLFKARLQEAETLLTQQERQDVVHAAQVLFERCIELVSLIDFEIWWRSVGKRIAMAFLGVVCAIWLLFIYWRGRQ